MSLPGPRRLRLPGHEWQSHGPPSDARRQDGTDRGTIKTAVSLQRAAIDVRVPLLATFARSGFAPVRVHDWQNRTAPVAAMPPVLSAEGKLGHARAEKKDQAP